MRPHDSMALEKKLCCTGRFLLCVSMRGGLFRREAVHR